MQVSCASLRMHAACVALPLKAPVSAWSATRRLVSNKSSKTFLHTVQAAEQRTASEDPSNVDIKETSPPKQKGQSPAEQPADHSSKANISSRDPEAQSSVKQAKEGNTGLDGPERQKTAEKMMDDAEGAGGHGYS
ncbi:TPA: hypothetical protein ACH3X3_003776 [Trebouxia sp. C0006]